MSATVWLNGEFVAEDAARLSPQDRGFLLGDGVFDTFGIRDGGPMHFSAHMARLRLSAFAFGLPVPFRDEDAEAATRRIAAEAGVTRGAGRLTLSRGQGPRGLVPPDPAAPTYMLAVAASGPSPDSVTLCVSDVVRSSVAMTSRHKTLSYIDNVEARRRAALRAFGEALMLNERGEIACASAANVFWIERNFLYTPSLECGVLAGITRARVLAAAAKHGLEAREARTGVDALARADAMFLTNSVLGLVPVRALENSETTLEFETSHPRMAALRAAPE